MPSDGKNSLKPLGSGWVKMEKMFVDLSFTKS